MTTENTSSDPSHDLAGWLDHNYQRQVQRIAEEVRRAADHFEDNATPRRSAVNPAAPLDYVRAAAFGIGQLHQAMGGLGIGGLFTWARDAEVLPLTEASQ